MLLTYMLLVDYIFPLEQIGVDLVAFAIDSNPNVDLSLSEEEKDFVKQLDFDLLLHSYWLNKCKTLYKRMTHALCHQELVLINY